MKPEALLRTKKLDGKIWNTVIASDNESLVFDVRNEEEQLIQYYELEINSMKLTSLGINNTSWWSSMEAYDDQLYISQYQDKQDPTQKKFFKCGTGSNIEIDINEIPNNRIEIQEPFTYEMGTEYFEMIIKFLALELPLSCEYFEKGTKIILSYYLRSDNGFDRYLLILEGNKKILKVLQDKEMKGFAPGAFFVLDHYLIFIRNRNEICIYPL